MLFSHETGLAQLDVLPFRQPPQCVPPEGLTILPIMLNLFRKIESPLKKSRQTILFCKHHTILAQQSAKISTKQTFSHQSIANVGDNH
jgi:hypothetical protein